MLFNLICYFIAIKYLLNFFLYFFCRFTILIFFVIGFNLNYLCFFCCHPNCRFANLFLYLNPKMFHILWFTTKNFQSHSTLFFVVPCILYRLHNPFNSFNIIANYVHIYIYSFINIDAIFVEFFFYVCDTITRRKKNKRE